MPISFSLDYSNMMAANIGSRYGFEEEELDELQAEFEQVIGQIAHDRSGGRHRDFGFIDLPELMAGEVDRLTRVADELAAAADAHLILGIGGSYLGARMLFEALCHSYHNELSPEQRCCRPRIYFAGNGIDNDAVDELLERFGEEPLTVHVVSKSGETLETAVAFRLARARCNVTGWAATTDPDAGRVRPVCAELKVPNERIFNLPENVGGRYSVLTPVGLLPAAVMGLDIRALLEGAAWMRERCRATDLRENPAGLYAGLQYLSLRADRATRNISVLAVWDCKLESFGLWLDQLSAESLGKDEQGRTPLTIVCTRELHSRGQQHQEGIRDKVICNLVIEQSSRPEVDIPADEEVSAGHLDDLSYVGHMSLAEVNRAAYQATDLAYSSDNRPGMTMRLGRLDERHLGALIYFFELATVIEGKLLGVNPLDQPGVRAYKQFLGGLLGRPEAIQYRDAWRVNQRKQRRFRTEHQSDT